jgi:hypothetical protein
MKAYLKGWIPFGETLEEMATVIAKDAGPLHSESEARVDNDGDDGYRGCVLGQQRTCHEGIKIKIEGVG